MAKRTCISRNVAVDGSGKIGQRQQRSERKRPGQQDHGCSMQSVPHARQTTRERGAPSSIDHGHGEEE
jgi:hypothetical protein